MVESTSTPFVDERPVGPTGSSPSFLESSLSHDHQSWLDRARLWDYSGEEKGESEKSLDLNGVESDKTDGGVQSSHNDNEPEVVSGLGQAARELSNSLEGLLSDGGCEKSQVTEVCTEKLTTQLKQVTERLENFRKTQELWRKRERENLIQDRRMTSDPNFIGWSSTPLNTSLYEIAEADEEADSGPGDQEEYVPEPRIAKSIVKDPTSRPRTRAQGGVADLPNVQPFTLERKRTNSL